MDLENENIWHVVPMNDLKEHTEECIDRLGVLCCVCSCRPVIRKEGEGYVVVHNSWDGREGVEWANEILNK